MTTLFVNGTIHSMSDPYATALLVDGGSVAWVGADDTAEQLRSRSGDGWNVVDLSGALVVPAFVDSLELSGAADPGAGPATRGVFLSVRPGANAAGAAARTVAYARLDPADVPRDAEAVRATVVSAAGSAAGLDAEVGTGGVAAGDTARLASAATEAGVQVYFRAGVDDPDAAAAVIDAVVAAGEALGTAATGRVRHRLAYNGPLTAERIEALARHGVSVTVVPDAFGAVRTPVASLLAAGVPVCLGSGGGPGDLWAAIRACLEHADPDQRVSARAGFTAATRAGLRALPDAVGSAYGMAGRIAPSAPATLGVWATEALSVQAPDGRVAAWSTDTRAGTPLLPVLEEGTASPRCLATLVDGEPVFRSAALILDC